MIVILTRPQTQKTPTANISKWSAVHNEVCYRFQRRDYSVVATAQVSGNRTRIQLLESEVQDLSIGDMLWVSSINAFAKVTNLTYASPFVYATLDTQWKSTYNVAGYANNHTMRQNYAMEIELYVWNNKTQQTESAGVYRVYPSNDGSAKAIVSRWLLKYLSTKEESTYTQVAYNDTNAWTRFYIGYRRTWDGFDSELFLEDRTNPFLGANLIANSTFNGGTNGWDLQGTWNWNAQEYITKPVDVNAIAYARPDNFNSFPTVAGKTYRIKVNWFGVTGTRTFSNTMRVWLSDAGLNYNVEQECAYEGEYEFDLVAPINGAFPTVFVNNQYFGSFDNLSIQEVNDEVDNTPRWMYVNKGALQIWNRFDNNHADHVAFYDDYTLTPQHRAKFICDFQEPTHFVGYPFDIAILFDDILQFVIVNKHEELIDVQNNAALATPVQLNQTAVGEQRIRLQNTYNSDIKFVDVWLETTGAVNPDYEQYVANGYVDTGYAEEVVASLPTYIGEITERRRVRINTKCYQNPVYIAWKGSQGGWNYWLFGRTQEITLNTTEQVRIEPYRDTLLTRSNVVQASVKSGESWRLGVDNVDLNDIKGLMRLLDSECVMIYLGTIPKILTKQWLEVQVKQGSVKVYETGNNRHNFEFSIDLPQRYTHEL